jgi:hypothetical protein
MKAAGEACLEGSTEATFAGAAALLALPLAFALACWWWVRGLPETSEPSADPGDDFRRMSDERTLDE